MCFKDVPFFPKRTQKPLLLLTWLCSRSGIFRSSIACSRWTRRRAGSVVALLRARTPPLRNPFMSLLTAWLCSPWREGRRLRLCALFMKEPSPVLCTYLRKSLDWSIFVSTWSFSQGLGRAVIFTEICSNSCLSYSHFSALLTGRALAVDSLSLTKSPWFAAASARNFVRLSAAARDLCVTPPTRTVIWWKPAFLFLCAEWSFLEI